MQVWKLTMNINFIQGRTTREVAAVCLYIACRRDNECKLMLIDFSELLEVCFLLSLTKSANKR